MSLNRSTLADVGHEEEVGQAVYICASIALGFIGFFGITMNLLVAVVIVKDAQILWTPVNVILVNLVVSYNRRVSIKLNLYYYICIKEFLFERSLGFVD